MTLFAKLSRYSAVSVVSTVISNVLLVVLVVGNMMTAGWANLIATSAGIIPSFELNRRWVWGKRGRRSPGSEVVPFCVLSFVGLVLSTIGASLAEHWALHAGVSGTVHTIAVVLGSAAAYAPLWLLQFALLDRWMFRAASGAA